MPRLKLARRVLSDSSRKQRLPPADAPTDSDYIPFHFSNHMSETNTNTLPSVVPSLISLVPPRHRDFTKKLIASATLAAVAYETFCKYRKKAKVYTLTMLNDSFEASWVESFIESRCEQLPLSPNERSFSVHRNYHKSIKGSTERRSKYEVPVAREEYMIRPAEYRAFYWDGSVYKYSIQKEDNVDYLRVVYEGKNEYPLTKLFDACVDFGLELEKLSGESDSTDILTVDTDGDWNFARTVGNKVLPVLPDGMMESIVKDLQWFYDNREWYEGTGIPYRRGVMFYGPPGSGKTTAAIAVASHFGKDIHVVPMEGVSDQQMQNAFSRVKKGDILLLEDIDICTATKNREQQTPLPQGTFNLRTLLNLLDGALSSDDKVIIATTNNIGAIDTTILRPGRFDVKYAFDFATEHQIEQLAKRFGTPHAAAIAKQWAEEKIGMADVQKRLMDRYKIGPQPE